MEDVTEFESQKKEFYNIALKSRTCFNDIVEISLFAYGGKFPQEVGHHVQYVLKEYDALFSAIEKASEEDDLAALEDRPDELENLIKAKGQVFNIAILRIHSPLLVELGRKGEC